MTKVIILALLLTVWISQSFQSSSGSCKLSDVSNGQWKYYYTNPIKISDVHSGVVWSFTAENVISAHIDVVKYLTVSYTNGILNVSTTPEFENYEKQESNLYFNVTIKFNCTEGERELLFKQYIEDINNHDPIFEKERYDYTIFMDVPESYYLTDMNPIMVTDYDLSNPTIHFEIEKNNLIKIEYQSKSNKQHFARLRTLGLVFAPYLKNFTIIAKDGVYPNRTSTAELTVRILNFREPIFTESLYYGDLLLKDGLVNINKSITLVNGLDDIWNVNITSNLSENFEVTVQDAIKIHLIKPLDEEVIKGRFILLDLAASYKGFKQLGLCSIFLTISYDGITELPATFFTTETSDYVSDTPTIGISTENPSMGTGETDTPTPGISTEYPTTETEVTNTPTIGISTEYPVTETKVTNTPTIGISTEFPVNKTEGTDSPTTEWLTTDSTVTVDKTPSIRLTAFYMLIRFVVSISCVAFLGMILYYILVTRRRPISYLR